MYLHHTYSKNGSLYFRCGSFRKVAPVGPWVRQAYLDEGHSDEHSCHARRSKNLYYEADCELYAVGSSIAQHDAAGESSTPSAFEPRDAARVSSLLSKFFKSSDSCVCAFIA